MNVWNFYSKASGDCVFLKCDVVAETFLDALNDYFVAFSNDLVLGKVIYSKSVNDVEIKIAHIGLVFGKPGLIFG
jgi:hypothetical protein